MTSPQKKNSSILLIILMGILVAAGICGYVFFKAQPRQAQAGTQNITDIGTVPDTQIIPQKKFRITHIMSYHSPWKWTDDQLNGFKSVLKDLNVEYEVFQMDTKRRGDESWKEQISRKIRKKLDTSPPDLIFAGDDNAQLYVTKYYAGGDIPIVFCGVNEDPEKYGFDDARNVTGILERMHYVATINLVRKLAPQTRKIAMITDPGAMWPVMINRMKKQEHLLGDDIEVVSYDIIPTFEEFKKAVLDYQDEVDALGFFGIFEFKDDNGDFVPMEDVLRWLQKNNRLPDFSFWKDRVEKETLCSVTVSGYAQGYQAGLLARKILVDGKTPGDLPMTPTEKGIPIINLETANRLGINPSADVLLTAEVIRNNNLD